MDLKEAGEIAQRTLLTAERERIEYADKEAQRTGCGHEAIIRAQAEAIRCITEQRDNALRELTDTRGYWHAARATNEAQAAWIKELEARVEKYKDKTPIELVTEAYRAMCADSGLECFTHEDGWAIMPLSEQQRLDAQAEEFAVLKAEVEKLKNDIRIMVDKAADKHLEGYRELGRRAAEAENARDRLQAEVERLKGEVERCQSLRWFAICKVIGRDIGCDSLEDLVQAVRDRLAKLEQDNA